MKLRCVADSIRFRLRKSDIELLRLNSKLAEQIHFPNGNAFIFGLIISNNQSTARCDENNMVLEIHETLAKQWMDSSEVSLKLSIPISNDKVLKILIEKDFPCKHTGEDFEDTYYELQPEEHKMYRQTIQN